MIEQVIEAYALKDQRRTGWELRGVVRPESVADHSWGSAYLVLVFAGQANVDRAHAVEIALVHDLAEALTGDVATRVVGLNDPRLRDEKREREHEAMIRLTSGYDAHAAGMVRTLWAEYEASETPESLFVRDMNMIDMCLQAYVYERDARYDATGPNEHFREYDGLDEFFATTRPRLRTDFGRTKFDEILGMYEQLPRVRERAEATRGATPQ
ncbi:MAG: HD domain-containing protein [Spirochaetota bacterium]